MYFVIENQRFTNGIRCSNIRSICNSNVLWGITIIIYRCWLKMVGVKISLTAPLVIDLPVITRTCICVLGVTILSISLIFLFYYVNFTESVVFFLYLFFSLRIKSCWLNRIRIQTIIRSRPRRPLCCVLELQETITVVIYMQSLFELFCILYCVWVAHFDVNVI